MTSTIKPTQHTVLLSACSVLLLGTLGFSTPSLSDDREDAIAACTEAARLLKDDDDVVGALEEANWCVTALQQLEQSHTLSLLPDEVDGFVGDEIDSQNMMGMSMIERKYTKGDQSFELNITTGAAAAAGLGALAQLGSLFGEATGGKKVRIQKLTAFASDDGSGGQLMISLKSGGSLIVKSNNLNSDELTSIMKGFPLVELDDALRE